MNKEILEGLGMANLLAYRQTSEFLKHQYRDLFDSTLFTKYDDLSKKLESELERRVDELIDKLKTPPQ